ncbi:hypothetical protein HFC64_16330 [Saccharolobus solfataricus]|uniref:DUF1102 domain-containing protein n=1 Tax=Saccharolobus solfataricus TaxID=2287 RepID=A0A7S9IL57_SACSO|nr:hypothetical protein [Saccharolobus solfataricus]QPG51181.1 hypothetical protein HFC64_16330 [Saccharolobus solfataricus]
MKKAPIIGLILGVIMLGLVFSSTVFTYTAARSFTVLVETDPSAEIALTPNNQNLGWINDNDAQPFIYLNGNGDLAINFHDVATNAMVTFYNAFKVTNYLNQTVSLTISSNNPHVMLQYGNTQGQTITINLAAGVSSNYITVILNTNGLSPQSLNAVITVTATYSS